MKTGWRSGVRRGGEVASGPPFALRSRMSTRDTKRDAPAAQPAESIDDLDDDLDAPNPGDPGPEIPRLGLRRDDPRCDPKLPRDQKRPPPGV